MHNTHVLCASMLSAAAGNPVRAAASDVCAAGQALRHHTSVQGTSTCWQIRCAEQVPANRLQATCLAPLEPWVQYKQGNTLGHTWTNWNAMFTLNSWCSVKHGTDACCSRSAPLTVADVGATQAATHATWLYQVRRAPPSSCKAYHNTVREQLWRYPDERHPFLPLQPLHIFLHTSAQQVPNTRSQGLHSHTSPIAGLRVAAR